MRIRIISPYHNRRFVYDTIEEWNELLETHISTFLTAIGLYFHGEATVAERIGKSKLVQASALLENCA